MVYLLFSTLSLVSQCTPSANPLFLSRCPLLLNGLIDLLTDGRHGGVTVMSDNRIRAVVVDDFRPFRESVVSLLKAEPDFEVVGQGDTAEEAIRLAMEHLPDLILLDITMPGGGLQAAQAV